MQKWRDLWYILRFAAIEKVRERERIMGRQRKVALLLAILLLLQPFFSERNTTSRTPSSPAHSERGHLMEPQAEALCRLFLSPTFIFHCSWMVPFFLLCCIASLDLLLKLVYLVCTLTVAKLTSEAYPTRLVT